MKKRFNTAGTCYPDQHYMMDNRTKLQNVLDMVERGDYFTINRPRQYGKTTTLFAIYDILASSGEYLPIELNFQGIDGKWHESDSAFAEMFVDKVSSFLELSAPAWYGPLKGQGKVTDLDGLSKWITTLARQSPKKMVLLIDEVDASSNFASFLNFLGMLRTKYLARTRPQHATFHSIVLVGVHDVKSLKYKLRDQEAAQYNSPWNIAAEFDVEMEFNPQEIAPMLVEYSQAENVPMDISTIAERLYYHTAGYPFLTSRLCQIIAEKIIPKKDKKTWELDDVEHAVQKLLSEDNTNFDSLFKNLENHADLMELVLDILLDGEVVPFNPHDPTIHKGVLYGVFKQNGVVKIHNRIYEQIIYNYLISKRREKAKGVNQGGQFALPDGSLDFERILLRFQVFMKEQHSKKDVGFLEREARLVFLAFIRPIINGKGHDFKEVQISDEKRLDVVVTFGNKKYVVELKIWRGDAAHQQGLAQLGGYLELQNLQIGYLVIFDSKKEQTDKSDWVEVGNKKIFSVWV